MQSETRAKTEINSLIPTLDEDCTKILFFL